MTSYTNISEKLFCLYFSIRNWHKNHIKRNVSLLFQRNEIDLSSGIELNINLLTEYNLNPFCGLIQKNIYQESTNIVVLCVERL